MAWLAGGLLLLLLAARMGRWREALPLLVAALAFAPFVYPLPTLAAGAAAAALLHFPLLWAARRSVPGRALTLLLLAAGAASCLFGLFGPKEGLF